MNYTLLMLSSTYLINHQNHQVALIIFPTYCPRFLRSYVRICLSLSYHRLFANNHSALKHLGVKCAQYVHIIMNFFSVLTFSVIYIAVSLILLVLAFIAQSVILSISVPIVNLPVFQGTSIPLTAGIIHRIY